jgi:outer membrane receptor protein involved in Fe transport
MKILNLWFIFCLCSGCLLSAQTKNIGNVSGIVLSGTNNKPLELVNVVVINPNDSSIVTGAVTNTQGRFEIDNVPSGEYYLRCTLLGFKGKKTSRFVIDSVHSKITIGTLSLVETEVSLSEVTVTSEKSTFNNTIDRKVYNVQQDVVSKTGTVSDLLQNIPSVQVDIDGTVSLRGSGNVLILINGKPSPLMGKSRAEVLQQMSASSIEKIEVITNPSAKFKPDGTSGIINIVMKKDANTGLNGSVSANAGNEDRYNGSVYLNYNPGQYNVFGSYSIRQDDRNSFTKDRRKLFDSTSHLLGYHNEDGKSYSKPISHVAILGLDYHVDESNSFGLSGNFHYRGFTRTETSTKVTQNISVVTTEEYDRLRYDPEYEKEIGGTAYFQHNFNGEDHKLRAEFISSYQPELEDNQYTNVYRVPMIKLDYDNMRIFQGDDQKQATVEYSNKLTENSTFETGYVGDFNKRDMDFYGEYSTTNQQSFLKDSVKTNHFIYNETIHALYATYENSFGSLSVLGGLRIEQSFINADLLSRDSVITNDYKEFYPTLHLSYKTGSLTELQLNYSRRANRPEGDDLNPFPEYQDPRNIRAGNPKLLPEFIHSVEFGFQWQNDDLTIVPSIFYQIGRAHV